MMKINFKNFIIFYKLQVQYGKPAHEGAPLKRGVPPQKGDCPLQEDYFHFASRFTGERTKIAKSDNDVERESLHARAKLCFARPPSLPKKKKKIAPVQVVV